MGERKSKMGNEKSKIGRFIEYKRKAEKKQILSRPNENYYKPRGRGTILR